MFSFTSQKTLHFHCRYESYNTVQARIIAVCSDSYEGESVNRLQIDIKHKTCDIRSWKNKRLFLDTSSTNTDTLVLSLYQCVETRSIEIF
jgi:hypothetical protein